MGGLIFGWAYIGGGGAYIWNEVSVSTYGGLIHGGGAYIRGGGAYRRRFTVWWLDTVFKKWKTHDLIRIFGQLLLGEKQEVSY